MDCQTCIGPGHPRDVFDGSLVAWGFEVSVTAQDSLWLNADWR